MGDAGREIWGHVTGRAPPRARAHLRALVEHLAVELERLVAEQVDVLHALLEDGELGAQRGDVDVERLDVLDALGVRALPRVQCGLLHLDLLVQPAELVVPLDQLGAEHVALGQDGLVLLLLLQPLGVRLVDDHVQREHLRFESRLLGLALADSLLYVGELIPQHL